MSRPYRHSVWFDVFGVVGLCVVLLIPLGFLATEMMGGGDWEGSPAMTRGAVKGSAGADRGAARHRLPPATQPSSPHFGERSVSRRSARAPFSEQWRAQATPDVTGPSAGAPGQGGRVGAGREESVAGSGNGALVTGPAPLIGGVPGPGGGSGDVLSAGRLGGVHGGSGPALAARRAVTDRSDDDRSAAGEAQRLAGRMWALSGQLRQMQRSERGAALSAAQNDAGSDPGSPDDPDRRNPGSPSDVPIGDHLHWLAALGILWGVWRLGRGA